MSRPPMASPRYPQPWSPRRPSPLGTQPPLAPHMAFASPTFPPTPDRLLIPKGSTDLQMRFPPEARRAPLAGSTHRLRSHTPTPLNLSSTLHPPNSHQTQESDEAFERKDRRRSLLGQQKQQPVVLEPQSPSQRRQPSATVDMRVQPSPLASSTSSLSLYSGDSTKKAHALGEENDLAEERRQQKAEESEKQPSVFCGCLNFKSLFGSKSRKTKAKEERILGPPAPATRNPPPPAQANPNPNRRRPSPLNI